MGIAIRGMSFAEVGDVDIDQSPQALVDVK
jgi:hypothetical protein